MSDNYTQDFIDEVKGALDSGSSGGSTIDQTARDNISNHIADSDVHVTAEEKTAWNAKAELSDIPSSLPANGGNADTAKSVQSATGKASLYEDEEGGNLRLTSPDGSHYVEMDCYNNEIFRMYFVADADGDTIQALTYNFTTKKLSINGNADMLDGLRTNDLAYLTNVIGGLRRGWASTDIGTIMTYDGREVVKTSNDLSYVGWTINTDRWFTPIIVSQYSSGTNYTMWEQNCGYDYLPASEPREGALITYKGRKYYACWQNPGSTTTPNVVGGIYVELTDGDFVKACKTLIDLCEDIDADTVDGLHANEIASNPNLLINPDFKINQRGITAPVNAFGADRWIGTYAAESEGISFSETAQFARQPIENYNALIGRTVTATVYYSDGTSESGTVVTSADERYFFSGERTHCTLSAEKGMLVWASSPCVVKAVKLEVGSVATPYSPPDMATEILKCKRFYQRYMAHEMPPAYKFVPGSYLIRRIIPEMRDVPQVNYHWRFGAYENVLVDANNAPHSSSTFVTNGYTSKNMLSINVSSDADSTFCYLPMDGDSYCELNAEI